MDMVKALEAHLKRQLATGMLSPEESARLVDEIHQVRRRVVRPRDKTRDNDPITVGVLR
jgi:hypothetical protein